MSTLRERLLWLGVCVMLPTLGLLGWLVTSAYDRELEAAQQRVRETAHALSLVVDREIDLRAMVARTLGAAYSLAEGDLQRFHEDARLATDGTGNWAFVVDGDHQLINTRVPYGTPLPARSWQPGRPLAGDRVEVSSLRSSRLTGEPVLAIVAPVKVAHPTSYHVGIAFSPRAIQDILDQYPLPPGWTAAVVDREGQIVARTKDAGTWLGKRVDPALATSLRQQAQGRLETRSSDDTTLLTYHSRSPMYGWAFVIDVPKVALTAAARGAALHGVMGVALLCLFTLGLVVVAARRLARPIQVLDRAARGMEADEVPPSANTGLVETDAVVQALRRAGLRAQLLRLITDKLPVLIGYVDRDLRFGFVNEAYEAWFSRPRHEIVGQPVREVVGEPLFTQLRPSIERALRGEEVLFEREVDYPGRGRRWIEARYLPHRHRSGEIEGFGVLVQDMTAHKDAERSLRRSDERQRLIVEIHDATRGLSVAEEVQTEILRVVGRRLGVDRATYAEVDASGEASVIVAEYNEGHPSLVGRRRLDDYGPEAIARLRAGESLVVHDVQADPLTCKAAHAYAALEIRSFVCVPLLRAGRFIALFAVVHASPRRWSDDELELLAQVAERTWFAVDAARAQSALRESRDVLGLAMRSGGMGAWSRDFATGHVWWSPELHEIFGVPAGEFAGTEQGFFEYVHPDDAAGLREAIEHALDHHQDYAVEFRFRHGSGEWRWMEGRGLAVYDAMGHPTMLYGLGIDVTARKTAADELRRLNTELAHAHRRKDEFLATLAHELRNPLAPISNAIEIMRLRDPVDGQLRWARDMIERQLRQLTHLVDDLLDVARITRGKVNLRRERVMLSAVVHTAVEATRPFIDAMEHRLDVHEPDDATIWLDADPTRLAQVLSNLLHNAAKYTPRGGRITLAAREHDGMAEVRVRDTGIGLAPEHLDGVFEMFSQVTPALDRANGGLGIGLSLVRGLVELHGGTVRAASDGPDRGTTFTVRLPLASAPAVPVPRDAAPAPAPARRRVLVVDDNRDVAESLAVMLQLNGHDVRLAYDGPSALAEASRFEPTVVMLDIGMPGMNGYEVAQRLRGERGSRRMLLIAVTGWGQSSDRQRALESGFDHHLTKPVDPAVLCALVGGAGGA